MEFEIFTGIVMNTDVALPQTVCLSRKLNDIGIDRYLDSQLRRLARCCTASHLISFHFISFRLDKRKEKNPYPI